MKISAYITFTGNCADALKFYEKVFGVKAKVMTYGEMPPSKDFPVTDEMKQMILHSSIDILGNTILLCDMPPSEDFKIVNGNNITLTMLSNNKEELVNFFNNLSEGGRIIMPVQETFYIKCYGCILDKFGITWQIVLD